MKPTRRSFLQALRASSIAPVMFESAGEDPATGSAAGCTSAWMVKYGVAQSDETVLIRQGVEIKRPSELFVRSSKSGTTILNVRVGGGLCRSWKARLPCDGLSVDRTNIAERLR